MCKLFDSAVVASPAPSRSAVPQRKRLTYSCPSPVLLARGISAMSGRLRRRKSFRQVRADRGSWRGLIDRKKNRQNLVSPLLAVENAGVIDTCNRHFSGLLGVNLPCEKSREKPKKTAFFQGNRRKAK
jgi:hypothetical protein